MFTRKKKIKKETPLSSCGPLMLACIQATLSGPFSRPLPQRAISPFLLCPKASLPLPQPHPLRQWPGHLSLGEEKHPSSHVTVTVAVCLPLLHRLPSLQDHSHSVPAEKTKQNKKPFSPACFPFQLPPNFSPSFTAKLPRVVCAPCLRSPPSPMHNLSPSLTQTALIKVTRLQTSHTLPDPKGTSWPHLT